MRAHSCTEPTRGRRHSGARAGLFPVPYLLAIQIRHHAAILQHDLAPTARTPQGLPTPLASVRSIRREGERPLLAIFLDR